MEAKNLNIFGMYNLLLAMLYVKLVENLAQYVENSIYLLQFQEQQVLLASLIKWTS